LTSEHIEKVQIIPPWKLEITTKDYWPIYIDISAKSLEKMVIIDQTIKNKDKLRKKPPEYHKVVMWWTWLTIMFIRPQTQQLILEFKSVQVPMWDWSWTLIIDDIKWFFSSMRDMEQAVLEKLEQKWIKLNPKTLKFEKILTWKRVTYYGLKRSIKSFKYEEYKKLVEKSSKKYDLIWEDMMDKKMFETAKQELGTELEKINYEYIKWWKTKSFLKFLLKSKTLDVLLWKIWWKTLHYMMMPIFFRAIHKNSWDLWAYFDALHEIWAFNLWTVTMHKVLLKVKIPIIFKMWLWMLAWWVAVTTWHHIWKALDVDKKFTKRFPDRQDFIQKYFWEEWIWWDWWVKDAKSRIGHVVWQWWLNDFANWIWMDVWLIWTNMTFAQHEIDLSTDQKVYLNQRMKWEQFWNKRIDRFKIDFEREIRELFDKDFVWIKKVEKIIEIDDEKLKKAQITWNLEKENLISNDLEEIAQEIENPEKIIINNDSEKMAESIEEAIKQTTQKEKQEKPYINIALKLKEVKNIELNKNNIKNIVLFLKEVKRFEKAQNWWEDVRSSIILEKDFWKNLFNEPTLHENVLYEHIRHYVNKIKLEPTNTYCEKLWKLKIKRTKKIVKYFVIKNKQYALSSVMYPRKEPEKYEIDLIEKLIKILTSKGENGMIPEENISIINYILTLVDSSSSKIDEKNDKTKEKWLLLNTMINHALNEIDKIKIDKDYLDTYEENTIMEEMFMNMALEGDTSLIEWRKDLNEIFYIASLPKKERDFLKRMFKRMKNKKPIIDTLWNRLDDVSDDMKPLSENIQYSGPHKYRITQERDMFNKLISQKWEEGDNFYKFFCKMVNNVKRQEFCDRARFNLQATEWKDILNKEKVIKYENEKQIPASAGMTDTEMKKNSNKKIDQKNNNIEVKKTSRWIELKYRDKEMLLWIDIHDRLSFIRYSGKYGVKIFKLDISNTPEFGNRQVFSKASVFPLVYVDTKNPVIYFKKCDTTYFSDPQRFEIKDLFEKIAWNSKSPVIEDYEANFDLVLDEISEEEFQNEEKPKE
jgi:hypothetical protein